MTRNTKHYVAVISAVSALTLAGQAEAQAPVTVDLLLAQGFAVVAAIPSNAGPGLFLQKGASLYVCFVAETPTSTAVNTQYCKPVH